MLPTDSRFCNIDFNGGNLSSDGGSILILEYLNRCGLKDQLSSIPFYEDRHLPFYSNHEIAFQLIAKNMLGYFNESDQRYLGIDPLVTQYYASCSQPTVSRFFSRASYGANLALKENLTKKACEFVNANVKDSIIIDADSTLVETKGRQEASAFISHYAAVGYHPLLVTEFHTKLILSSQLRTGSAYSSNGIIGELDTVFAHLNNDGTIKYRGDSAFYDTELMEYLENRNITYYIRAKNFTALRRAAITDLACDDIDWGQYDYNHPYYGDTQYEIGNCGIKRRIAYKAYWVEEDGRQKLFPEVYAIVTNDNELSPKEAMDFYEARGASENFNKELKGDFNAGTLSHQSFLENELEFLICSTSYNLFHMFQETILNGSDKHLTMGKFRVLFQKIAVRVSRHARRVSLAFSSAYKEQVKFLHYWNLVLQI